MSELTGSENAESAQRKQAGMELAAQHDKGVRAIGRFIFEFSQLEFSMKSVLAVRLKLTSEYFDIVTGTYDFAMLCTVTQEILLLQLPKAEDEIKELISACRELNNERVRVAHGLWTLGGDSVIARHVSRNSLKSKFHFEGPDELTNLAEKAQSLMGRMVRYL